MRGEVWARATGRPMLSDICVVWVTQRWRAACGVSKKSPESGLVLARIWVDAAARPSVLMVE